MIDSLSKSDSLFLAYLRGLSIFIIVFGHVGGFWIFRPYSEFLQVFVPIFFFLSGAVSFHSYKKSSGTYQYYLKRFTKLLIPYYSICILSLIVFFYINHSLPNYDFENLMKWAQLRPTNAIMVFPVGQVWFLHTLFFITVASPLYFNLFRNKFSLLVLLLLLLVTLSGIQVLFDVDNYFYFKGNNLYKPLIHSIFYIIGMISFAQNQVVNKILEAGIGVLCLVLSVFLVKGLNLNVDLAYHTFAPDLYYVAASLFSIIGLLWLKNSFIRLVEFNEFIKFGINFFNKHTFSIFLLHSFGIYLTENLFGLVNPAEKTIKYGIIKLSITLFFTFLLAIPFTKITSLIIKKMLFFINSFSKQ